MMKFWKRKKKSDLSDEMKELLVSFTASTEEFNRSVTRTIKEINKATERLTKASSRPGSIRKITND